MSAIPVVAPVPLPADTAVAAIGAYVGTTQYLVWTGLGVNVRPSFSRVVHFVLAAALVGYLGTHQRRFQYEISRLASWPRKPARDARDLVSEIIHQASEFLGAPRTVLVWEEGSPNAARVLEGHSYPVMCVAWSPDGKYLASIARDCQVKLWRSGDWELVGGWAEQRPVDNVEEVGGQ